jgi:predicted DNA-binding transcriptional regulator AlpA
MEATSEYLTDAQFCGMMNVTPRTTNEWRRNNAGPAYVRVGPRRILYRRADVDAWLASRTFRHRAAEVVAQRVAA